MSFDDESKAFVSDAQIIILPFMVSAFGVLPRKSVVKLFYVLFSRSFFDPKFYI